MKKYSILFPLIALTSVFWGCKKEYEPIGEVPSKLEGIVASWELVSCSMVDKSAIIEESEDITEYLNTGTPPNIKFSISATDTTYSTDTTGAVFNFFGSSSGRWRFDDIYFPTKVILYPDGPNVSEQIECTLINTIRPNDTNLKLRIPVLCNNKLVFTYDLIFSRKIN
jgi:hypothetical protein